MRPRATPILLVNGGVGVGKGRRMRPRLNAILLVNWGVGVGKGREDAAALPHLQNNKMTIRVTRVWVEIQTQIGTIK